MKRTGRITRILLTALVTAAIGTSAAMAQVVPTTAGAQPNGPDWQTLDEALERAADSGKRILVDVYAPWCGYCRKMQKETYTDDTVKVRMNRYFEFARLDGTDQESTIMYQGEPVTPAVLARRFGTSGYPTTVFLEPDGEIIAGQPGYIGSEQFTTMIEYVGTGAIDNQTYQEFVDAAASSQ